MPPGYNDGTELTSNADVLTYLYGGDMLLTPEQMRAVLCKGSGGRRKRKVVTDGKRWATTIPYSMDQTAGERRGADMGMHGGDAGCLQTSG